MSATVAAVDDVGTGPGVALAAAARRNAWTLGLLGLLVLLVVFTKLIQPSYGAGGVQSLGISVLPLAFAAVAQAVVVIAGGIDLSIGSMMALISVITASLMQGQSDEFGIAVVIGALGLGLLFGAINGWIVVVTRVPDIIVTLAMLFVWAGFALIVRSAPGGQASPWLMTLVNGKFFSEWVPKAALVLLVVVAVVWIPLSRSKVGLSIYAVGSNQLAAFRSGIDIGRTKVIAYAVTGLFAAIAGLSLTASTGIGTPVPGPYTLESVAAVVLGGVSLAGGRGGVFGPIVAVVILQLIQTDMTFLNLNSNLAVVAQGVILIGVLVLGSIIELRRERS
ncbi:MAG TPA: ABC transporter permease [Candidatus Limnocylindrales bacterium]|nr:ABC transporter permease [Candidatus Limnocylindrales bacterium]